MHFLRAKVLFFGRNVVKITTFLGMVCANCLFCKNAWRGLGKCWEMWYTADKAFEW